MRADIAARIALVGILLTTVGCTERTVTSTSPVVVAPSPTPAPPDPLPAPLPAPTPAPSPPVLPLTVFSITFDRASLFAGENATGTVLLSRPAPGPVVVTLTSSDPGAVVIPQTVTIGQDRDRITFPIATSQSLAEDRGISISGLLNDSSTSGALQVWTIPRTQSFFTFISEPGEYIGGGRFVRLVSPAFRPMTTAVGGVTIDVDPPLGWFVAFYAPRGSQLTVRRYDSLASSTDATHASMSISGQGRGCSIDGIWFEIRELNITSNGDVARFDATFEQRCRGSVPTLRGEIRFVR